jgi:hypothetical protein
MPSLYNAMLAIFGGKKNGSSMCEIDMHIAYPINSRIKKQQLNQHLHYC